MPVSKDIYCNQAYLTVTESGANTLTFNQLLTSISIYEKIGWIIARMEYKLTIDATDFAATDDAVQFGISTSDQIASIEMDNSPVIDTNEVRRTDLGTAANGLILISPIVKNFSDLPGGGIIVPPNPIYIFVKGYTAPNAFVIKARMFYTVKQLKTEDYWELVEMRRMVGA